MSKNLLRRAVTHDVAFTYRMGAGFAGDVNRTHPASIEPTLLNQTNPPTRYGDPVIVNTADGTVRRLIATDTAVTRIYGVLVRPFPTQQTTSSGNYGAAPLGDAAPPTGVQVVQDTLRLGYILSKVVGTPTKDGAVFVWIAATSGNNIQGGFQAAASGGNTVAITNARFNGPPDANGVTEVVVSMA